MSLLILLSEDLLLKYEKYLSSSQEILFWQPKMHASQLNLLLPNKVLGMKSDLQHTCVTGGFTYFNTV